MSTRSPQEIENLIENVSIGQETTRLSLVNKYLVLLYASKIFYVSESRLLKVFILIGGNGSPFAN